MQTLSELIDELCIRADTYLVGVVDTGDTLQEMGFLTHSDVYAVTLIQESGLDDTVCRTMHVQHFGRPIVHSSRANKGAFTPPSVLEVLGHLHSEARMAEDDFEEWATVYFGDMEPSKTLAEWKTAQVEYGRMRLQRDQLKWMIGADRWEEFLYETES